MLMKAGFLKRSFLFFVSMTLALGTVLSSCGKKDRSKRAPDPEVKIKFGPKLHDTVVDFSSPSKSLELTEFSSAREGVTFRLDSAQWLGVANDLLDYAESQLVPQRKVVADRGRLMIRSFYEKKNSSFDITPEENPYKTAAYTYSHEKIKDMGGEEFKSMAQASIAFFRSRKIPLKEEGPLKSVALIDSIESYLTELPTDMEKAHFRPELIKGLESGLNANPLLGTMKDLRTKLASLHPGLQLNADAVLKIIRGIVDSVPESMLSPDQRIALKMKLSFNERIVTALQKAFAVPPGKKKYDEGRAAHVILGVLVEFWEDPTVPRGVFPKEFSDFIKTLSENDRKVLATETPSEILDDGGIGYLHTGKLFAEKLRVQAKLKDIGLEKIRDMVLGSIAERAVALADDKFSQKITEFVPRLNLMILDQLLAGITSGANEFARNVDAIYEKSAAQELENRVFYDRPRLPVLEKASLDPKDPAKATAEVLAEGLKARFHILNQWRWPESSLPVHLSKTDEEEVRGQIFSIISKLLVIGGYDDYQGHWSDSLHVHVSGPVRQENLMIKNYQPEKAIFAVPDDIYLKNSFIRDSLTQVNPQFSVIGQMSLLEAYSRSIRFFKKWKPNVFDETLGAEKYRDEFEIFPKSAFYQMSIGLASVILNNLKHESIVLIDRHNQLHLSGQEVLTQVKERQSAALVDFDRHGLKMSVTARDIAAAIEGLVDILEAVSDFEKTQDEVLRPHIGDLVEARPLIDQIILGLANFAGTRLQQADGGFARGYDFKAMKSLAGDRQLEDQLLLIRSILKAAKHLRAPLLEWCAVDGFYFLKAKMFSSAIGFFKASEQEQASVANHVYLKHVALLLTLVDDLRKAVADHTESVEQIDRMESALLKRFFGPSVFILN